MRNLTFLLLFSIISLLAADHAPVKDPYKLPDGFHVVYVPPAEEKTALVKKIQYIVEYEDGTIILPDGRIYIPKREIHENN